MNAAARTVVIGIVVVIVVALLAYFAWQEKQASEAPAAVSTSTPATASTSTGAAVNVSATTSTTVGGYTITPITASGAPTPPNYEAPLVFSDQTLSADEETAIQSEFAQAQAGIKANSTDYGSWIELGTLRMEAGDYSGAAADWNYVTELYPNDPTAYANLGNLYASYLNEPSQGIADYKEAIKLDPTQEVSFYQNLAQIYINEGDTADAKAVLEQGINAQVSGYQNLQTMLQSIQG